MCSLLPAPSVVLTSTGSLYCVSLRSKRAAKLPSCAPEPERAVLLAIGLIDSRSSTIFWLSDANTIPLKKSAPKKHFFHSSPYYLYGVIVK